MGAGKYNFDLLYRHSNEVARNSRTLAKKEMADVRSSFAFLAKHFDHLERQEKSHLRNVKLALTTRFTNHLFAHVLLAERGLFLDAAICVRSATETTAFYWLVCMDPSSCELYDTKESPRPVEIRKRLEKLDVNVGDLRDQYGLLSAVGHVGNRYDGLQIKWEREKSGKLLIGGGGDLEVRRMMLGELPKLIVMFVFHDPDYEIRMDDDKAFIKE